MPTSSAILSLVPNHSMARFFNGLGTTSMTRSPTSRTGDWIRREVDATSSATARPPAPLTSPANPARAAGRVGGRVGRRDGSGVGGVMPPVRHPGRPGLRPYFSHPAEPCRLVRRGAVFLDGVRPNASKAAGSGVLSAGDLPWAWARCSSTRSQSTSASRARADPAPGPDVGRAEVALRVGRHQFLLGPGRGGQDHAVAVVVVVVPGGGELAGLRPAPTDQASSPWLIFSLTSGRARQMSRSRSHRAGSLGRSSWCPPAPRSGCCRVVERPQRHPGRPPPPGDLHLPRALVEPGRGDRLADPASAAHRLGCPLTAPPLSTMARPTAPPRVWP